MNINQVREYNNPKFQGVLKVNNYNKSRKAVEKMTTLSLDKGLSELALNNFFNGNWKSRGHKTVDNKNLLQYIDVLQITTGINIPKNYVESAQVELKRLHNGYSIKYCQDYKITHLYDEFMIRE